MQFDKDKALARPDHENKNDAKPPSAAPPPPKRKPYTPPKLIPWGTLRDVTRSVGPQGASDGGTKNKRGTR